MMKKTVSETKKTVAVGRDACPVGIRSHEIVKGERGAEDRGAGAGNSTAKKKDAYAGEEKERSPGKEAMIGGKEKLEQEGRGPMPLRDRDVAGFDGGAIDNSPGNESGQKAEQKSKRKEGVGNEQTENYCGRFARRGGGT